MQEVVHGERKSVVEARDRMARVDSRGLAPEFGILELHFSREAVAAEAQLVAQRRRENVVDQLCLGQLFDLDFAALDRVLVLALFSRLEHLAAKPAVVQLDRSPRTLAVPPLVWQARVWPRSWGSLPPLLLLVTQLPAAEVLGALLRGKQGFQLLLALSYKISESVC